MTPADDVVSVVVPARNEARRLGPTLRALLDDLALAPGDVVEIVVVDDGSSDGTGRVVEATAAGDDRVRLIRTGPDGKGHALRVGHQAARGSRVAFLDADLPIDVVQLRALVDRLGDADLVAGTRTAAGAGFARPQPLPRRAGGWVVRQVIAGLGMGTVSDPQCGAKGLRRPATDAVVAACCADRFAFDVELLARARSAGLRIVEHPVRWRHVDGSTLHPVPDALRTFRDLLAVRRRLRAEGDRAV